MREPAKRLAHRGDWWRINLLESGVHRNTIARWPGYYQTGGLDALLAIYMTSGKPLSISPDVGVIPGVAISSEVGMQALSHRSKGEINIERWRRVRSSAPWPDRPHGRSAPEYGSWQATSASGCPHPTAPPLNPCLRAADTTT